MRGYHLYLDGVLNDKTASLNEQEKCPHFITEIDVEHLNLKLGRYMFTIV